MKKLLTFCLLLLFSVQITAQVGINTTTPNATLDIRSSNQAAPSNVDGILIPKIDDFPAVNPGADQDAMLVYLTTTSGSNLPGFYYWDNTATVWVPVGQNTGWSLTGNSGTVDGTHFLGTTDNVALNFRVNDEMAGRIDSDINTATTSFGYGNLANTTGIYNSAFGYYALLENTTGFDNTAVGVAALRFNETGANNTALGSRSMRNNTTGNSNVAIGMQSLFNNTTGIGNVAIGHSSAINITTGSNNVAIGREAYVNDTNGGFNVAVGYRALSESVGGNENTALGVGTLEFGSISSRNTAVGRGAMINFSSSANNTAVGFYALSGQTFDNGGVIYSGYNVAVGHEALRFNNPTATNNGRYNVALGAFALHQNLTGSSNTALGMNSFRNSTNSFNTGLGMDSGFHNTGTSNTFLGYRSGFGASGLSTGGANTAVGSNSLNSITSGTQNTAMGDFALGFLTTGNSNVGIGAGASDGLSTGSQNTSVGFFSGRFGSDIFTGSDNAYLGYRAGQGNRLGSNNTIVGSEANVGVNNLVYATAIGSGAVVSQSNSIALGGNTVETRTRVGINQSNPQFSLHINQLSSLGIALQQGTNNWEIVHFNANRLRLYYNGIERGNFDETNGVYTSISDRRLKSNIQLLDNVLSKVNQLKPSSYTFNHDENKKKQIGFIAQEVEELFPEFVHYSERSDDERKQGDLYTMDYSGMSVIAIKAIQEQQLIIDDLIKRIEELEEKINKQ